MCNIFRHTGVLKFRGDAPQAPKTTNFWVRLMGVWLESPASGVGKYIFGYFRARGSQETTFLRAMRSPLRGVPCPPFFTSRAPPIVMLTVMFSFFNGPGAEAPSGHL
jgi:hypothetical protein